MAFPFAAAAGMAGLFGSVFGGNKKNATPASSEQKTGYYAAPPEAQAAYQKFFEMLNNVGKNPYDTNLLRQATAPTSPFDSQELFDLQQKTKDRGVEQIGVIEPLHQFEKNAYTDLGNADYSLTGGLAKYFNPFQEQVINRAIGNVNRESAIGSSNTLDRFNRGGSRVLGSSLGTQLAQQDEGRLRAIGDLSANLGQQGFKEAVGLRGQTLAQMLGAGGDIRAQNQRRLDAASGRSLASSNPAFGRAQAFMELLQGIPGSSYGTSTAGMGAVPNNITKAGNVLLSLFGNQMGGGFGGFGG